MRNCQACGKLLTNRSTDPGQPDWQCTNSNCVKSFYHKDATCPVCKKPPDVVVFGGCGFTDFQCEDGHRFTVHASELKLTR